jgi:hypothetical protein
MPQESHLIARGDSAASSEYLERDALAVNTDNLRQRNAALGDDLRDLHGPHTVGFNGDNIACDLDDMRINFMHVRRPFWI